MVSIGYLEVELYIPHSHSLKEKRMVVKRIKERVKNKFNVAICEAEAHDKWQTAVIAIVSVSTSSKKVDETLEKVVGFIEKLYPGMIKSYHKELI
ncbi:MULTISPECIES: DUF503 domain-containing protein [unclassified Desulfurobacterium]|uniref:DUF503 domain-containing protein n=1 Tax=unclassified Desulfurobacterium TaxID=2639089 RepID=UPI0003B4D411|nr:MULTISPECIES: DUF503 domain-containing protein [unclassified Desulfurobacterium]